MKPDTVLRDALDGIIDQQLREEDEREREEHHANRLWPREWLAAGRLGWPLQWQVLYALGCPQPPIDSYIRRKFKRGRDVEEWFVNCLTIPHERQVPLEYQQVVGYADAVVTVVDGNPQVIDWAAADFPGQHWRRVPWEIKSVKASKFSRLKKQGPDHSHCLQACCYALALGTKAFTVIYIAFSPGEDNPGVNLTNG